jgi:hypothetical protein
MHNIPKCCKGNKRDRSVILTLHRSQTLVNSAQKYNIGLKLAFNLLTKSFTRLRHRFIFLNNIDHGGNLMLAYKHVHVGI